MAMLTLTAIHDIMKIPAAAYCMQGRRPISWFRKGTRIFEHDVAHGCVLACDPTAPSFDMLPEAQKAATLLRRTGFNHGWLVQGEAPPGILFGPLRLCWTRVASQGGTLPCLLHWVTDVAGAEPTPLNGVEKLVLKFPTSVFRAREVDERRRASGRPRTCGCVLRFLQDSWLDATPHVQVPEEIPPIGVSPSLPHAYCCTRKGRSAATCRMRIWLPPAEDLAALFRDGFDGHCRCDVPNTRMTGGQACRLLCARFLRHAIDDDIAFSAFADLQRKERRARARATLLRCACSQARKLFPRSESDAASTVIVHLAAFKNESIFDIASRYQQGQCWLNVRTSANECGECHSITAIANVGVLLIRAARLARCAALSLWPTQIMAGIPAPAATSTANVGEHIAQAAAASERGPSV